MKFVKVVCGIIWKGGRVLIAKRKPEKSLAGYWEFPGGKLETNEDAESALVRELKEEMGMSLKNIRYYDKNIHQYDEFKIELIAYNCDYVDATFQLTDHDDIQFVLPHQISEYKIAPADVYFVNKLNSGFKRFQT
jgi:8-oxo-dGTP diphosphatase